MAAVIRCKLNYSDCRRGPIIYTRSGNTFSLSPRAFAMANDRKHAMAVRKAFRAVLICYPHGMARYRDAVSRTLVIDP